MLCKNYSQRDIAGVLNRSQSTISDEITRNSVNGIYDPKKAHHKASVRRRESKYQGKKIVTNSQLQKFVEEKLYDDQSPEAIAGRLTHQERAIDTVSKNSIYRFIKSPYGRKIEAYRQKQKHRKKYRKKTKRNLNDRTFIEKRPKRINKRHGLGHAEADFIVSGKQGKGILLVVVDRKTRKAFLELILIVTINNVHHAFQRIKQRFPELQTITLDNDILFQKHRDLERLLKVRIYFCNPYHSWEKGSVENANKEIRKTIPKGSDLSKYSKRFIRALEEKLNRRIMKCLHYRTPDEAYTEAKQKQTRDSVSAERRKTR